MPHSRPGPRFQRDSGLLHWVIQGLPLESTALSLYLILQDPSSAPTSSLPSLCCFLRSSPSRRHLSCPRAVHLRVSSPAVLWSQRSLPRPSVIAHSSQFYFLVLLSPPSPSHFHMPWLSVLLQCGVAFLVLSSGQIPNQLTKQCTFGGGCQSQHLVCSLPSYPPLALARLSASAVGQCPGREGGKEASQDTQMFSA